MNRRSKHVTRSMVLAAAVMMGVISCDKPQPVRNRYESIKDCEDDYGQGKCETGPSRAPMAGSGFYYFGPWYQSRYIGSRTATQYVGSSAGESGISTKATGVVNGAGEHMAMPEVRSTYTGSRFSSFSGRGATAVSPSSIGGFHSSFGGGSSIGASRGGFGGVGHGFSAGG